MSMQDMRIAWEEPFGPIIPVIRVKSIDDAIDHCNSNNLALQVWPVPPTGDVHKLPCRTKVWCRGCVVCCSNLTAAYCKVDAM